MYFLLYRYSYLMLKINESNFYSQVNDKRCNSILHVLNPTLRGYTTMI